MGNSNIYLMNTISANKINSSNSFSKNKNNTNEENNQILLNDLKNKIDELEKEKLNLKQRVDELKERIIDLNIAKNEESIKSLEKERDDMKIKASNSLALCSKMAEELIILRDKLDNHNYTNKK